MEATRSRMPRQAGYVRRSTVWNGCLEKVKRSAAGSPSTLPQMGRLPRRRTPQRTPLPNGGQGSRHGRQPGPPRPLRHRSGPHRRPPSLPSKRRGPISGGNPPLPLSRPPKLGRWLRGNRAGSRPEIGHRGVAGQRSNPRLRVTAERLCLTKLAGKLGGAATLHHAQPPHPEHTRAGRLKDVPFQGRACPYQRELHALRTAR